MVTANNYMFRALTGHQVVHLKKRARGCTIYNVISISNISINVKYDERDLVIR
jgi:hypothetical protein